jgi:hypothetical protein
VVLPLSVDVLCEPLGLRTAWKVVALMIGKRRLAGDGGVGPKRSPSAVL